MGVRVGGGRTGGSLVGRDDELAELQDALAEARAGRGRVYLVAGEAGIGKTTLAETLADLALPTETRVRWGRCWEGGGAPAFWPWIQVLRAQVQETLPEALAAQLGPSAADVAQLVPELMSRLPEVARAAAGGPGERFRQFDSVASFLRAASAEGGLLVILEDVHAADEPSLLLLQFLAGQASTAHLLVLATYRDAEASGSPKVSRLLHEVGRHARRLRLGGLDEAGVAALLEREMGVPPTATLVRQVYETTEGNPFFVLQLARLRARGRADTTMPWGLPEEVREVIRGRLEPLEPSTREALAQASVIGREFELAPLERLRGATREGLLETLDPAMRLGLVEERGLGRWSFSHALLRETLYDDLPLAHRVELHRRVAEILEGLHGADQTAALAELAHHFFQAARRGEADRALRYCSLAGDRAASALAWEEAAQWYRRALEALDLVADAGERRRYDLLVALGEATMRSGSRPQGRRYFRDAAVAARSLGCPELLGRAALGFAGVAEEVVELDRERVNLLDEAIEALPADDSPLRARLLSALAGAWIGHDHHRALDLSEQALKMARRLNEPETLVAVLWEWHYHRFSEPATLEERLAASLELVDLGAGLPDRGQLIMCRHWRAADLFQSGDLAGMRSELAEAGREAAELRVPFYLWGTIMEQAGLAILEGRLEEAERLAHRAHQHGSLVGFAPVDGAYANQMLAIHWELGRFAEQLELAETMAEKRPDYLEYPIHRALALAELGRATEARTELGRLPPGWGASYDRWELAVLVTEVCWVLGEQSLAPELYLHLDVYRGRHASLGIANASLGAGDRTLGLLATLLGRYEDADTHFEAAERLNERLGAPGWLARSRADHAAMLLRRNSPGDRDRASSLLRAAVEGFRALGLNVRAQRAEALFEGIAEAPPVAPSAEAACRREGEFWSFGYAGRAARLKDSKGLHYLACLLRSPGREFHALDLVVGLTGQAQTPAHAAEDPAVWSVGTGDAGPVLDAAAKAAYRRRLAELEEEIDEATLLGDAGRLDRARQEREFLVSELAAAVGLGGRDRRAASDVERARQSVTRAVKGAVQRIAVAHPALGEHLRAAVRTGVFSVYLPDPRAPIVWRDTVP